jgi:hypothetical protein
MAMRKPAFIQNARSATAVAGSAMPVALAVSLPCRQFDVNVFGAIVAVHRCWVMLGDL